MRVFCAPRLAKTLASGLVMSLLLTVLAPLVHVDEAADNNSFSDWLRAQVPVENDAQFDEALQAAEEQNAEHIADFIRAFVDAHDAPDELAALLGHEDGADLFTLLTNSSESLGSTAVLPRVVFGSSVLPNTLDRVGVAPSMVLPELMGAGVFLSDVRLEVGEHLVYAFRLFSSARSLGP